MTRVMDVSGGGGGGIGHPPPSGERSPRLSMWIKEAKLCV